MDIKRYGVEALSRCRCGNADVKITRVVMVECRKCGCMRVAQKRIQPVFGK